jgi:hypothetical protein
VSAVATDLIDEAAEKGRAAFMRAQALACAATGARSTRRRQREVSK